MVFRGRYLGLQCSQGIVKSDVVLIDLEIVEQVQQHADELVSRVTIDEYVPVEGTNDSVVALDSAYEYLGQRIPSPAGCKNLA